MALLAPAWLLALAAVALPVLLHLFSRGRERRVRVGSTRLMAGDGGRRARSFRPSQLLLLALRCLLLAAVALALAEARRWTAAPSPTGDATWVLVEPALFASSVEAVEKTRARIDGHRERGDEIRWLAPGLPAWDPGTAARRGSGGDLWSLVREADLAAAPGVTFAVLATDRVASLRGRRPRLVRPATWTLYAAGGDNAWIERAGPATGDTIPVVVGISDPERTRFEHHELRVSPAATTFDDRLQAGPGESGELRVALRRPDATADDDGVVVPSSGVALSVLLLHDPDRRDDAAHVRAALAAVEHVARIPLDVETVELPADGPPAPPDGAGLVFRMSSRAAGDELGGWVARGGTLVMDDPGPYESCDRIAHPAPGRTIRLRQCHSEGDAGGAPLWLDSRGAPLLSALRSGDGLRYHLHGRFHPLSSDLVLSPAFPEWLASLVDRFAAGTGVRSAAMPASDLRRDASGQLEAERAAAGPAAGAARPSRGPELLLWLMVFLLLATERLAAAARSQ